MVLVPTGKHIGPLEPSKLVERIQLADKALECRLVSVCSSLLVKRVNVFVSTVYKYFKLFVLYSIPPFVFFHDSSICIVCENRIGIRLMSVFGFMALTVYVKPFVK